MPAAAPAAVKEVVYTEDVRDYTTYTFKPQLRTVGPKYGKQLTPNSGRFPPS